MVQLVKVDKRRVLPFNVEKTIPPNWILDIVSRLPTMVLPVKVDTKVVETDRVEKVRVERVMVLP
jgi:hypothetical protein